MLRRQKQRVLKNYTTLRMAIKKLKIVKIFYSLAQLSKAECNQKIRMGLRLGRAATKELEKILLVPQKGCQDQENSYCGISHYYVRMSKLEP